jgi:hypothetical protein
MQARRKQVRESEGPSPQVGSRPQDTEKLRRAGYAGEHAATVRRLSPANDQGASLAQSHGEKVQRRKLSAADRIIEIDRKLAAMTPDEYAREVTLKRVRTRLIRKATQPSEHDEQVRVIDWANAHVGQIPELKYLFAVPNGGKRHKKTAKELAREGLKSGVPDLLLLLHRGVYSGLAIEMKTLTGAASREQKEWLQWLAEQGYCARLARGADMAIKCLTWYLQGAKEPDL